MKIGLDIDNTITAAPKFFALLSKAVKGAGRRVCIVTSTFVKSVVRRCEK